MKYFTKKEIIIAIFILLIALAWWFRFDTHCTSDRNCVAYDRFTGQWFSPNNLANTSANETIVRGLLKDQKKSLDYKKAILYGYSYQEIINDLRNPETIKKE